MELILIHRSHHGKWFYDNFNNEINNKNIKYDHFELLGHGENMITMYTIDEYANDLYSLLQHIIV